MSLEGTLPFYDAAELEERFGHTDTAGRPQRLLAQPGPGSEQSTGTTPAAQEGAGTAGDSDARMTQTAVRDWLIHQGIDSGGGIYNGEAFAGRNEALFEYAKRRRDEGCPIWVTTSMALGVNRHNRPPLDEDEVRRTIESVYSRPAAPRLEAVIEAAPVDNAINFRSMASFGEPRPVEWLEPVFIPRGRLILSDGEEGIGKGLMAAHFAAKFHKDGIIWAVSEDDPRDDIKPRVRAAAKLLGIDLDEEKIWFPDAPLALDADNRPKMKWWAKELQNSRPAMVILDPGRTCLTTTNQHASYNDETAWRKTLEELNSIAIEAAVAAWFIAHWNKMLGGPIRSRTSGSAVWRQTARHASSMAWRDDGMGAMNVTKSNVGPRDLNQEYSIVLVDGVPAIRRAETVESLELGEWLRQGGKVVAVSTDDQAALVTAHLSDLYDSGAEIETTREEIAAKLKMPRDDVKKVLAQLVEKGAIMRREGRRSLWFG